MKNGTASRMMYTQSSGGSEGGGGSDMMVVTNRRLTRVGAPTQDPGQRGCLTEKRSVSK